MYRTVPSLSREKLGVERYRYDSGKILAKPVHTEQFFPKIKGLKVDQITKAGRQLAQLILPQVQQGQHVHLTEHHQYYYDKGLQVNQIAQTGRPLNELISQCKN
jgi:hypothetical protein